MKCEIIDSAPQKLEDALMIIMDNENPNAIFRRSFEDGTPDQYVFHYRVYELDRYKLAKLITCPFFEQINVRWHPEIKFTETGIDLIFRDKL